VADEREKEKERLKALQANSSKQETAAWPTAAVRQRTATLRAEHNAAQASATPSASTGAGGNDESREDGNDDDDEDGENDGCEAAGSGGGSGGGGEDDGRMGGSQRTRRRASKLDRRQVLQAIARYDVSQKED
jgi:hypothetical protein